MNTKGLPYSDEAEKALLGAIVLQPKKILDAIELRLNPEDFYFPKHQTIFRTMLELYSKNLPIDPIQITALLKPTGEIGATDIVALAEDCYRINSAPAYVKIIQDKSILRQCFHTFRVLSEQALEASDCDQFIQTAQTLFLDSMPKRIKQDEKSLVEGMQEYLQRMESMGPETDLGFMTGFKDFDLLTKGLRKGQLVILAGRPGMGKSAFSTSIILNRIKSFETTSAYIFSLEMTDDEISERAFSGLAQIDGDILKGGNLRQNHWHSLSNAHQMTAKNSRITVCSAPNITTAEILAKCKQKLIKDKTLDFVVVDYLQLITCKARKLERSKEQEISEISRDLKNMAKELKTPILALSQLNRDSESREGHRPKMSDLRYSGSLEQDADLVCLMYRDDVYNPETSEPGVAEITLAKNRSGKTGTFKLTWKSKYTLFENLSSEELKQLQNSTRPVSILNKK